MAAGFQHRKLRFTFELAQGTFDKDGKPNKVVIQDVMAHVVINAQGSYEFAHCKASIYGISQETMNALTVINFLSTDFYRNSMVIEATDDKGQYCVIFEGSVLNAMPNYQSMPSVPLEVDARSGLIGSLKPVNPDTFSGAQKVSVMMARLASDLGMTLENNGVETILVDQVLTGTTNDKIMTIQQAARISVWIDEVDRVLAIAPIGYPRKSTEDIVSAQTGMVGNPIRLHNGVFFRTLFSPNLRGGKRIKVESQIPSCNGIWYVQSMTHNLSCNEPGGPWFTEVIAPPVGMFIKTA